MTLRSFTLQWMMLVMGFIAGIGFCNYLDGHRAAAGLNFSCVAILVLSYSMFATTRFQSGPSSDEPTPPRRD